MSSIPQADLKNRLPLQFVWERMLANGHACHSQHKTPPRDIAIGMALALGDFLRMSGIITTFNEDDPTLANVVSIILAGVTRRHDSMQTVDALDSKLLAELGAARGKEGA